jgi:hypothetical protein
VFGVCHLSCSQSHATAFTVIVKAVYTGVTIAKLVSCCFSHKLLAPIIAPLFGWFGEAVKVYGFAFSSAGVVIVIQFTAPPVQSAAEQTV